MLVYLFIHKNKRLKVQLNKRNECGSSAAGPNLQSPAH